MEKQRFQSWEEQLRRIPTSGLLLHLPPAAPRGFRVSEGGSTELWSS